MNHCKTLIAAITCLCLLFCLSGCRNEPAETTAPAATTAPEETTAPAPSAEELYAEARMALDSSKNLTLSISQKTEQTVGGEVYSAAASMIANYMEKGSAAMTAMVKGTLTYGTYVSDYTEFYTGAAAYCQTNEKTFSADMTATDFVARQLPAALLDAALYETITVTEDAGKTVIAFSGASHLESWVTDVADLQLVSAGGTATLDANGAILETTYTADYVQGGFPCHLEATVSPSIAEQGSVNLPKIPDTCTKISYFDAPKLLLQSVGHIFSAEAISAQSQELLVCAAAALVRNYQAEVNLHGSGTGFLAGAEYTASVRDYTGTVTSNSQTESYRNGTFSYTVNGGEPTVQTGVNAGEMRTIYEDFLLNNLFTPDVIQDVTLTDTGDFYCLQFTGNDTFSELICDGIYQMIQVDLDSYSTSFTTPDASGYLTIDKNTGLPTAFGQSLKRTHIIDNIPYDLTFDFNQSLYLSSATAYESITGTMAPEAEPENKAKPLFYKVTGKNGEIMWLLGTIHVGDARTAYLPQEIYDAFLASDALAVEMDVDAFEQRLETDAALQQQIAAGYYYADGSKISSHIDSEVYEAVKLLMMATGSYSANAEMMKASLWENAINNFLLRQTYTLTSNCGVEQRLLAMAREKNMAIRDVEDPVTHALLATNYSEKLQEFILRDILDATVSEYREEVNQLYELWCQGDEYELEKAIMDDVSDLTDEELLLYGEYNKAMMTDRNAHMLNVAKQYLESGDTVFYAVGLAHVLAHDGLVNTLRDAGYTVELVTYN